MFFFYRAARTVLRPRHRCSHHGSSGGSDALGAVVLASGFLAFLALKRVSGDSSTGPTQTVHLTTAGVWGIVATLVFLAAAITIAFIAWKLWAKGNAPEPPPQAVRAEPSPKLPPEPPRPQAYYSNRR